MEEIDKIRENYKNFDDSRIIKIIKKNLKILNPQTMAILKEEAMKRDVPEKLIKKIDLAISGYNAELNQTEFYGYLNIKTVQLNENDMEVVLPVLVGGISFFIRAITNRLPKLKISYDKIDHIYEGNGKISGGGVGYNIVFKKNDKKQEIKTTIHLLNSKEIYILFKILKKKGVKICD